MRWALIAALVLLALASTASAQSSPVSCAGGANPRRTDITSQHVTLTTVTTGQTVSVSRSVDRFPTLSYAYSAPRARTTTREEAIYFRITNSRIRSERIVYAELKTTSGFLSATYVGLPVVPSLYDGTGTTNPHSQTATQLHAGIRASQGRPIGSAPLELRVGFAGNYYHPITTPAFTAAVDARRDVWAIAIPAPTTWGTYHVELAPPLLRVFTCPR